MTGPAVAALVVAVLALAGAVVAYLNALQVRRRLWKLGPGLRGAVPGTAADEPGGVDADRVVHLEREVARLREQAVTWKQSLRHVAVVRYDAFGDVAGAQSWSLAILDDSGDGVVVTAINGRDAARTYAKNVRAGESDAALSPEELEAIAFARADGLTGPDPG